MILGANCSALLPLCRSDYQPINRAPNCLGSDAGNYLYTLMESIFHKKGHPLPCARQHTMYPTLFVFLLYLSKRRREMKKKNRIHFFFLPFSSLCAIYSSVGPTSAWHWRYLFATQSEVSAPAGTCIRKFFACMGRGPLMPGQAPCHLMNRDIGKEIPLHFLGVRPRPSYRKKQLL